MAHTSNSWHNIISETTTVEYHRTCNQVMLLLFIVHTTFKVVKPSMPGPCHCLLIVSDMFFVYFKNVDTHLKKKKKFSSSSKPCIFGNFSDYLHFPKEKKKQNKTIAWFFTPCEKKKNKSPKFNNPISIHAQG